MNAASSHDGTMFCSRGGCQLSATGTFVNAGIVGGTSVAAPTMAGVQALIDSRNGGRQGLPNFVYYALADAQHTAGLNCSAETPDPSCAFHDVDTGNTLVCGDSGCTAPNQIGWTAAAGYDLASGLGSPNVTNLANLWPTLVFNSSSITMSLSQTSGITHGQPVTITGSVTPGASNSAIPTGNVAFIASSGAITDPVNGNTGGFANPVSFATLDASGNYSISLSNLPAGNYFLTARYGGDGTFASSLSTPVAVNGSPEDSTVTIEPNFLDTTSCIETAQTTFVYGSYMWTDFVVAGGSQQGVPTGTVAVTDNGNPLVTTSLNATGIGHMLSGGILAGSCVSGFTFQDTPVLSVGTHMLGATYSGDSNFNSMTATPVTVTINKANTLANLVSGSSGINSGDPVQLNFTALLPAAGPGTAAPSGTVTFTDTTTSTTLGTATLSPISGPASALSGMASINTTGITGAAGAHSIQASWPGDGNYNALTSGPATVTIQAGTATTLVVTSSINPAVVGARPPFTATVAATPTAPASGTVNFYDGSTLLASIAVGAAHTATFRPAAATNLPAGTHTITAVYTGTITGSPVFNASTSVPLLQVFNPLTATLQLTAKNNGTFGEAFTMSTVATVVPATPPTGMVTFLDGVNAIGSVPLTAPPSGSSFQAILSQNLNAGTHTITAQLSSDANYAAATSNAQTITVNPATAVLAISCLTAGFDGNPHGCSATATGLANASVTGATSFTYNSNSTTPTNAGTYTVSASFTSADGNYTGSGSSTLNITQATPTLAVTCTPATFDGNPHACSAAATGVANATVAGTSSFTYNGNATAPTNAGTYAVMASFLSGDTNYTNVSGSSSLTIAMANQSITFGAIPNHTFGDPDFAATATASSGLPVSYLATGNCMVNGATVHITAAGPCGITASQAGNANFNPAANVPQTFAVAKATPGLSLACPAGVIYDGSVHACTSSVTGVGGASVTGTDAVTYNGSPTAPSNVGNYAVSANFTSGDSNYNNASVSSTLAISSLLPAVAKLTPVITAANSGAFTLNVNGTNFVPGAVVNWNGSPRTTTFVGGTQISAAVQASDLATVGLADVTTFNPAPGGGTSTAFKFAVDTPAGTSGAITASTSTTTLTVTHGQSTTMQVTFAGVVQTGTQINAACFNLPAGATCSLSGTTVTISTTSSTPPGSYEIIVVFTATQTVTSALRRGRVFFAAGIGLLGLPFGLVWIGRTRKKALRGFLLALAGFVFLAALSGCGGGPQQPTTTSKQVSSQSSLSVTLNVN